MLLCSSECVAAPGLSTFCTVFSIRLLLSEIPLPSWHRKALNRVSQRRPRRQLPCQQPVEGGDVPTALSRLVVGQALAHYHFVQRDLKRPHEPHHEFQGWRVLSLLPVAQPLPSHSDALRQIRLRPSPLPP